MGETQEASQESTDSVVTDEMLDRAADGVDEVEEVATEDETTEEELESEEVAEGEEAEEIEEEIGEEEAEDTPEEPEDNAERSRLGRRVSELETALLAAKQESQSSTAQLNETLQKLTGVLGKKEEVEEEEFFELPETKEDLAKLVREQLAKVQNEEVTQKTQAVKDYESGYIDTVGSLLEGDPDSEEILKLVESDEFNIKHSKVDNLQSGMKDAAKNILAAKTKLLSGSVKKVPLKGEKPRAPLGGGDGGKVPVATKKRPKLDAAAEQYVKENNVSDEDVIRIFG
jgi:hypothetical protein